MTPIPEISERRDQTTRAIRSVSADLLARYPIDGYIRDLIVVPRYASYRYVAQNVRGLAQKILDIGTSDLLDNYHKLTLLTLVGQFEERVNKRRITDEIRELYVQQFHRIVRDFDSNPAGFYSFENDLFLKDLGLCTLRLIPAGAELMDECVGVGRRLLLRAGLRQLVTGIWFFAIHVGGFKPLYQMHLDPRTLGEFSPEGWDRTYLRIAALLEVNPEIKGMIGGSWFYDPHLEDVSPHLAYLRVRRQENGAKVFYAGSDPASIRDALETSSTRSRLYEEGKYAPARYVVVWPRKDMIRWARNFDGTSALGDSRDKSG